jgi:hypothetical protein
MPRQLPTRRPARTPRYPDWKHSRRAVVAGLGALVLGTACGVSEPYDGRSPDPVPTHTAQPPTPAPGPDASEAPPSPGPDAATVVPPPAPGPDAGELMMGGEAAPDLPDGGL